LLENSLNLIASLRDDLSYAHQFLAVHAMGLMAEKMTYASQFVPHLLYFIAIFC
jgi:hypothetical protein